MSSDVLKRVIGTSVASPYTSSSAVRSRHTLYGTDDRVILDLGSRVWKFGLSGESRPRGCVLVSDFLPVEIQTIWTLDKHEIDEAAWRVREQSVKKGLRKLFHEHLGIDPRTRKVVIVDNPLLSAAIKRTIVQTLFDNLQVPSVSFASHPVCSVMSCGMSTGLVIDIGHLETVVMPVFHSRPLFTYLHSTTRAGNRLTKRLRSLLLKYAAYVPPPTSLSASNVPRVERVPESVLTDELCEEIKTRACFIGSRSTGVYFVGDDDNLDNIEAAFPSSSTATSLTFPIPTLSQGSVPNGRGWLHLPGWVRERAAEVLFEDDFDERAVTDAILDTVLKLPIDLRRPMIANMVITGGTATMPSMFSRLKDELEHQLAVSMPSPPPSPDQLSERRRALRSKLWTLRQSPPYSALSQLSRSIRFVNSTEYADGSAKFAFEPHLAAWVGASIAAAIKATGSHELVRESWDGVIPEWPDLYWRASVPPAS